VKRGDIQRHAILARLAALAPEDPRVSERLAKLEKALPELVRAPVESPAEPIEEGHWPGPRGPMSAEELRELDLSSEIVIDWLLTYNEPNWNRNREGLLDVLELASREDFEWSLRLADVLRTRGALDSDVVTRVLRAWATRSDWSDDQWESALRLLSDGSSKLNPLATADLLEHGLSGHSGEAIPVALLDIAESVAVLMLDREAYEPSAVEVNDWLTVAINHTGGKVALFLLRALSARLKDEQVVVGTLPAAAEKVFTRIAHAVSPGEMFARIVLASQVHFLDQFSTRWVDEHLIPGFDWEQSPEVAVQLWHGYLTWGRISPRLANQLMDAYVQCVVNRSQLPSMLVHQLFSHLAVIALMPRGPDRTWLNRLVALDDVGALASWSRGLAFELRETPTEARKGAWDGWIGNYWRNRVQGVPRPISPVEAAEQGAWPLLLPFALEDAVDLATRSPAQGMYSLFFSDLQNANLPESSLLAIARLARHLMAQQDSPLYQCADAVALFHRFRQSPVSRDPELSELREALLRLGCDPGD
jgi:hypothetical protein